MQPQLGIWKRFIRSLLVVDRCSLSWGSRRGLLVVYQACMHHTYIPLAGLTLLVLSPPLNLVPDPPVIIPSLSLLFFFLEISENKCIWVTHFTHMDTCISRTIHVITVCRSLLSSPFFCCSILFCFAASLFCFAASLSVSLLPSSVLLLPSSAPFLEVADSHY